MKHNNRGQATLLTSFIVVTIMAGLVFSLYRGLESKTKHAVKMISNIEIDDILDAGASFANDLYTGACGCKPRMFNSRLNLLAEPRKTKISQNGQDFTVTFGPMSKKGATAFNIEGNWASDDTDLSSTADDVYLELSTVIRTMKYTQWILLVDICTPFKARWPTAADNPPSAAPSIFFLTKAGTEFDPAPVEITGSSCTMCRADDGRLGVYGDFVADPTVHPSADNSMNYLNAAEIPTADYKPHHVITPEDVDWLKEAVTMKDITRFYFSGSPSSKAAPICTADLNGDGFLNAHDSVTLQKYLLGLYTKIPLHRNIEVCTDNYSGVMITDGKATKTSAFP